MVEILGPRHRNEHRAGLLLAQKARHVEREGLLTIAGQFVALAARKAVHNVFVFDPQLADAQGAGLRVEDFDEMRGEESFDQLFAIGGEVGLGKILCNDDVRDGDECL